MPQVVDGAACFKAGAAHESGLKRKGPRLPAALPFDSDP